MGQYWLKIMKIWNMPICNTQRYEICLRNFSKIYSYKFECADLEFM